MATFQFNLVSPEKLLFSGEVDQVDVPGAEGDFGVLAGHAPFVTTLRPGILTMYRDGGDCASWSAGGFAEVSDAGLTVLADVAVPVEDVNRDALRGLRQGSRGRRGGGAGRLAARQAQSARRSARNCRRRCATAIASRRLRANPRIGRCGADLRREGVRTVCSNEPLRARSECGQGGSAVALPPASACSCRGGRSCCRRRPRVWCGSDRSSFRRRCR